MHTPGIARQSMDSYFAYIQANDRVGERDVVSVAKEGEICFGREIFPMGEIWHIMDPLINS